MIHKEKQLKSKLNSTFRATHSALRTAKKRIYLASSIVFILFQACQPTAYFGKTYRAEALKGLSKNESKKVYRIDLSRQNLTKLPIELKNYPQLSGLNLSNNPNLDWEHVIENLSHFEYLTTLILDSNQVNELPQNLSQLRHLKQLSLAGNPNLNLNKLVEVLLTCRSIDALNLSNNQLKSVPSTFKQLSQLKNLRLSYNELNTAESFDILGNMKLKILWLDDNKISELPENIYQLDVVELYLDNNAISKMPSSISACSNLCVLYLGNNEFEELPSVFKEMKMLKFLVLNQNKINSIPIDYADKKYPMQAMVLDQNKLSAEELKKVKKYFGDLFLISYKNQFP